MRAEWLFKSLKCEMRAECVAWVLRVFGTKNVCIYLCWTMRLSGKKNAWDEFVNDSPLVHMDKLLGSF